MKSSRLAGSGFHGVFVVVYLGARKIFGKVIHTVGFDNRIQSIERLEDCGFSCLVFAKQAGRIVNDYRIRVTYALEVEHFHFSESHSLLVYSVRARGDRLSGY